MLHSLACSRMHITTLPPQTPNNTHNAAGQDAVPADSRHSLQIACSFCSCYTAQEEKPSATLRKAPDTHNPDCVTVPAEHHNIPAKANQSCRQGLASQCTGVTTETNMSRSYRHSSNGLLCQHCISLHRLQHVAARRMFDKTWLG